ncbi:uncharacterized protein LOC113558842 [Rhopalosiphum maidis]|uniref:uncharacterized protein LOC113558842 n=1 Tax=Rhopalosiphum maidis TaxID=43146 RepID=UPI000EFF4173|nr:uncharacterized protein LOC113558842 [Rhopalosiphum maidis]
MNFSRQTDELLPNENEGNHGRHDAHKHHDTMGEIVQGQEFPNNVKNSFVDLVDNHVKEVNPHAESLGTHQINKDGNCVERDLLLHSTT